MKILHVGNIASVAYHISRGQRELGHTSDVVTFHPNKYTEKPDYSYDPTHIPLVKHILRILWMLWHNDYDLLHFHGQSILWGIDLILWRLLGKKVIIHHHGSDIRNRPENPFNKWLADLIIVATPDLTQYSRMAHYIPNPVNPNGFTETDIRHPPNYVHLPSATGKGTDLFNIYCPRLTLIQNVSHQAALLAIEHSDIVCDQITPFGAYGVVAIEGMASGKLVLSSINPEYYPSSCPIIPVNESNLKQVVNEIENGSINIEERAAFGPIYVNEYHHYVKTAEHILKLLQPCTCGGKIVNTNINDNNIRSCVRSGKNEHN